MGIISYLDELVFDSVQYSVDMLFICEVQQLLAEVIGIRVHHDLREDGDESFEKFIDKLIVVIFPLQPSTGASCTSSCLCSSSKHSG